MATTKNTATTFTASGISFAASDAKSSVKRANILLNTDGTSFMTTAEINEALYAGRLQASQLYHVVLAFNINDTITGVKLTNGSRLRLAGQRDKEHKLVGAAPDAHSLVRNQIKLKDASNIKGTITTGKDGSLYLGYSQDDSTYNPCVASVSAAYDKDQALFAEITALIADHTDKELLVYYVPTVDFKAFVAYHKKQAAKSA